MEGDKSYPSPLLASRYAAAFNREDRDSVGRRPLLSVVPVALARRVRGH